jgi:hypothetical protein
MTAAAIQLGPAANHHTVLKQHAARIKQKSFLSHTHPCLVCSYCLASSAGHYVALQVVLPKYPRKHCSYKTDCEKQEGDFGMAHQGHKNVMQCASNAMAAACQAALVGHEK